LGIAVVLGGAGAAAEPRSATSPRPLENASRLRVSDARVEVEAGAYESGQLYVRITDIEGLPVINEVPVAVVASGGVHVGPFSSLGNGNFVARVEWAEGTPDLTARLAVGDATADVPTVVLPRRPGRPPPREARSAFFVLGSLGVGAGSIDHRLGLLGFRGALDWSVGKALGKSGLSLALGVHLGYERHSSAFVHGLAPLPTVADVSILEAGFPITLRLGASDALVVPYVILTPTFYVRNSRFVADTGSVIDVDASQFGLPTTFGFEVPVGPGGVFLQGTYRATVGREDDGKTVSIRGALGEAGYHLVF
jgi:hypothetical protein